jgi:ribosome-associated protein
LSATKRTPPKSPDRPMIRSSHGAPRPKARASDGEAAARPRPARGTKPRAGGGATRRARVSLPKGEAAEAPTEERTRRPDEESRLKKAKPVPAGTSSASDDAREVAIAVAVAALDKKASGLEVIDVAGKVDYADFLVLMSGRSDRHVAALASGIEEALRKRNKRALAVEGLPHANWVLMDFGDVVVHVFQDDARATYDIDGLWMDARRVPVQLPPEPGR